MKFAAVFAVLASGLILGAGYAVAGAGAQVPAQPEGGPPSGRPGPVLDDAKCKAVWEQTERQGDTLSEKKAAPFIVNTGMVDTNDDGKITQDEFSQGCKNGWVQEQPSKPGQSGGGETPEQPQKSQPQ
jgi:hypothetical protein